MSEIITDKLTGRGVAKTVTVTVGASATQSLEQGLVKSWVLERNDSTMSFTHASLNVASVVDNGNGDSTFTVTNAFSSAAFVCTVSGGQASITDRFGQAVTQNDGQQDSSSTYRAIAFDVSASASNHIDSLNILCIGSLA